MGIKLPTKDQWVGLGLGVIVALGILNKLINISPIFSGAGTIVKEIPNDIFTIGISYFMIAVVMWIIYKSSNMAGERFSGKSLVTLVLILVAIGAAYIFIIEPFTTGDGHLPLIKTTASIVNTQVQAIIGP